MSERSVLCRAQYSTSIGGRNEPIPNVGMLVSSATQDPTLYFTGKTGQVYIPLLVGETYDFKADYEGASKLATLTYKRESMLLISIDPNIPRIYEIALLQPRYAKLGFWALLLLGAYALMKRRARR